MAGLFTKKLQSKRNLDLFVHFVLSSHTQGLTSIFNLFHSFLGSLDCSWTNGEGERGGERNFFCIFSTLRYNSLKDKK